MCLPPFSLSVCTPSHIGEVNSYNEAKKKVSDYETLGSRTTSLPSSSSWDVTLTQTAMTIGLPAG